MKKVYISGKISGLELAEAREKFDLAEVRIRRGGYQPVNPFKLNSTPGLAWEEYMLSDIKHLFKCDMIALLPCWGFSKGARIERAIAMEHGLSVIDFDDKFLKHLFLNATRDIYEEVKVKGSNTVDFPLVKIQSICEIFGVSEESGIKWMHEYKQYGLY